MGKTRKKRRFIEKSSCWEMFGLLCWLSGFGGVLLSTIGGLSIYKPDIPLPFIEYALLVIGTIVFLMAITGIRIRSQWSSTLMEIRGIKERTKGTSSNDELCKLTEILVGFMSSMESFNKELNAKTSQNQKEIIDSLNQMRSSLDDLKTYPSQLATLISEQGGDISSILASLGDIEGLLSQREWPDIEKNKGETRETATEEDAREEIKKEINSDNDRLKYV